MSAEEVANTITNRLFEKGLTEETLRCLDFLYPEQLEQALGILDQAEIIHGIQVDNEVGLVLYKIVNQSGDPIRCTALWCSCLDAVETNKMCTHRLAIVFALALEKIEFIKVPKDQFRKELLL